MPLSRREAEQQRLYDHPTLTRALLLEVGRPGGWDALASVWQGVQDEWGWPAPAIAVNGRDGFQLWFSLAEPVAPEAAQAVLDALRARFLGALPARAVRQWPAEGTLLTPTLPPAPVQAGQWSAFVTAGLAPIFADAPWLDIPPADDGQADLLTALRPIDATAWRTAVAAVFPQAHAGSQAASDTQPPGPALDAPAAHAPSPAASLGPRQFLLQVMQDDRAPLALRVEAAKALLAHPDTANPRSDT